MLRLTNNRRGLTRDFQHRNLAQRLLTVPSHVDLTVLVRRDTPVELALPANVRVRRAGMPGVTGLTVAAARSLLLGRFRRLDAVVTDQSSLSGLGYLLRRIGGYCWTVDLVDSPHKQAVTARGRDGRRRSRVAGLGSRAKVWVHQRVLPRADLILASVAPGALERYGVPSGKVQYFRNALSLREYPRSRLGGQREPHSLCYVASNFFPDYGVDVLIAAISRMPESLRTQVRCRLAGKVPEELGAAIDASPVAANFERLGHLAVEEVHDLIATSEIGLVPFHWNEDVAYTYPVKMLEYMALGAVVVASDLPGIRALVENRKQALLVAPGDAAALTAALIEALGAPDMRTRIREAARMRVEQLDAGTKAAEVYGAIESAVADQRRAG